MTVDWEFEYINIVWALVTMGPGPWGCAQDRRLGTGTMGLGPRPWAQDRGPGPGTKGPGLRIRNEKPLVPTLGPAPSAN